MTGTIAGAFAPAASLQEVQQLIGFLGEGPRELARIEAALADTISAATEAAEAQASPIKAALTEAQAKVQAWSQANPSALPPGAAGDVTAPEVYQAQLAAMLMASARPVTERQRSILALMKEAGAVLRRQGKLKSYGLFEPGHSIARKLLSTNHVFDLQGRFLDAYDAATGERLLAVSAFEDRHIEFRIKPDVVLP
jgi:hypothetical protein